MNELGNKLITSVFLPAVVMFAFIGRSKQETTILHTVPKKQKVS